MMRMPPVVSRFLFLLTIGQVLFAAPKVYRNPDCVLTDPVAPWLLGIMAVLYGLKAVVDWATDRSAVPAVLVALLFGVTTVHPTLFGTWLSVVAHLVYWAMFDWDPPSVSVTTPMKDSR